MRRAPMVVITSVAAALAAGAVTLASSGPARETFSQFAFGDARGAANAGLLAQAKQPANPDAPHRTETTVHDSWTATCHDRGDANQRVCTATLQVVDKERRQVLFSWIIGRVPKGALTSVFQVPTGVQIQPGVSLKLGQFTARKADYSICLPQRCEASLVMDERVVREAVASSQDNAVVTITLVDGRQVTFTVPLKGLDKSLALVGL